MTQIDFNNYAEKVHQNELTRYADKSEKPLGHYLMRIVASLGCASTGEGIAFNDVRLADNDRFKKHLDLLGFEPAYERNILGTTDGELAEAAINIFNLLRVRGIEICGMDNMLLNMAPSGFAAGETFVTFNEWLYDLIGCITHRNRDEMTLLDCIKLWEKNPEDEELYKAINEELGDVDSAYDIEMRTSYGFENYIVTRKLMPVLVSISSWFKAFSTKDMVWHINARLYYNQHHTL